MHKGLSLIDLFKPEDFFENLASQIFKPLFPLECTIIFLDLGKYPGLEIQNPSSCGEIKIWKSEYVGPIHEVENR